LQVFLDFRIETITRRTRYQLRKAQERDHLLQGYLIALANLDAVIALIRGSADAASAKAELVESYGFSSVQADAILQMQLRRLTALESEKIEKEHEELTLQIADLEDILANRSRILAIIKEEVSAIRAAHANDRRTVLQADENDLSDISLIANEQVAILVTEQGYIKRMLVSTFEAQNRATRGKSGTKMKDDDGIEHFITCCTHDHVVFFTDRGVSYSLRAYQIPESSRTAKGYPLVQMLPIPKEEKVTSVIGVSEFTDDEYLVMLTQGGYVKKTALSAFSRIRTNGLIAISLNDGDELRWVRRARAEDSILIGSQKGMTIHFKTDHNQLRPLGRPTKGVRAMSLRDGDKLISMDILSSQMVEALEAAADESEEEIALREQGPWVLVVSAGGLGKRVPFTNFRLQNRAGMGLVAMKFRKDNDELVALRIAEPDDELMIVSARGIIMRQSVNAISIQSRMATGVQLQRLDDDDAIAAVALVPHLDESENDMPSEEVAEAVADTVAEAQVVSDIDDGDVETVAGAETAEVVTDAVSEAVAETETIVTAEENSGSEHGSEPEGTEDD
ncbi:MAG: DNA gyrase C-terminal beta-propeller domain-containing protein, partial [Cyanobacteria bacterium J06560_5]